jgi:hypothetical protein
MAGGARAGVRRTWGYERLVAGWHDPARSSSHELRQVMALHEGLELDGRSRLQAEEWTDEAHNRALLAAGLLRFVDGGGQLETDAGSARVHRLPAAG